ncbi:MAG: hypothetical protein J6L77_09625 [Coprococcus sp.]|nr:hypothetical protein [Coprococcus sp.]
MEIAFYNTHCKLLSPFFYIKKIEGEITLRIKLETLQDAFECYGKDNLIPIDLLKQIIFYTSKGVQPVYICESEKENRTGQIVCWFLKSETQWVYQKWKESRPEKTD